VVGAVGAGKSTFLAGVLGEAVKEAGRVDLSGAKGKVAFCSQSAWVQNLSVKENILFGSEEEEGW